MYKTEQKVIEDYVVSKGNSNVMRHFTGGKNALELPLTVSFSDEGDYQLHISEKSITINRVDKTTITKEDLIVAKVFLEDLIYNKGTSNEIETLKKILEWYRCTYQIW